MKKKVFFLDSMDICVYNIEAKPNDYTVKL